MDMAFATGPRPYALAQTCLGSRCTCCCSQRTPDRHRSRPAPGQPVLQPWGPQFAVPQSWHPGVVRGGEGVEVGGGR